MPVLIKRKENLNTQYHFELNEEETKRFLNEFLGGFLDTSKLPEGHEMKTTVSFVMDMVKSEVQDAVIIE